MKNIFWIDIPLAKNANKNKKINLCFFSSDACWGRVCQTKLDFHKKLCFYNMFYSKIGLRGVLYCSHEDRIDDIVYLYSSFSSSPLIQWLIHIQKQFKTFLYACNTHKVLVLSSLGCCKWQHYNSFVAIMQARAQQ